MLSNDKENMLKRAASDIGAGMVVNLGIGLPQQVLQHIPAAHNIVVHSENGLIGMGGVVANDKADRNLIDAGGAYVSMASGGSYVDSAVSFAMIRNGRLDMSLLGAFEVSACGDLANWMIPKVFAAGAGGGIELAQRARFVGVVTMHCDKKGRPKILEACRLPLTAPACVDRIYTDMAVFDCAADGLTLHAIAEGVTIQALQNATEAEFKIPDGEIERY